MDAVWLIAALLLSAVLVACGYGPEKKTEPAAEQTAEEAETVPDRAEIPAHEISPIGSQMGTSFFTGEAWAEFFHTGTNLPAYALVTFAPGARNSWHSHGGGQVLIVTGGEGWVQEAGSEPVRLREGDVWYSRPGVTHWHGALDGWFQHIAVETNAELGGAIFYDPVRDELYNSLTPPVGAPEGFIPAGELLKGGGYRRSGMGKSDRSRGIRSYAAYAVSDPCAGRGNPF